MNSSNFLHISGKCGGRFEWTGSVKDLDKFFSALGYTGTWSQPTGEGHPQKFTNKRFTCTWYATKKSLLIQGKKSSELKDKLRQVLDERTESDTLEVDGSEVNEVCKSTKFCDGCVAS